MNNLKNVNVKIPYDKLVVVTGVSGSGKSSLAFDTLYAEGQRRYVVSLSSYARQFLGRMDKPDCDFIIGIPPAIAVEQKVSNRSPRSTVGTSSELSEYMGMLFARIGKTFSPKSGQEVKKHSVEDIVNCMLSYPEGTKYVLLSALPLPEGRTIQQQLEIKRQGGFSRIEVNGKAIRIEEYVYRPWKNVFLLIDRMVVEKTKDAVSRLTDSAEAALSEGEGRCMLRFYLADGSEQLHSFSTAFEADGMVFEEPSDQLFSRNSPVGNCQRCFGCGRTYGIDKSKVVPDKTLSVYDGAVKCWFGHVDGWKDRFINDAEKSGFPIFTPYNKLTKEQQRVIWEGDSNLHGVNEFFRSQKEDGKRYYRYLQQEFYGEIVCPDCKGAGLRPEANYVRIGGKNISELSEMPIGRLKQFFDTLELDEYDKAVSSRLLKEINSRIKFLVDIGLEYLTLNRYSETLSGGESQRITLATLLGSNLVGSLYVLDEPSIGMHSRDTGRLINVLRQLQKLGNTVVVVEHDEEIIRAADYMIDIGPDAGRLGGEVVYQGDMKKLKKGSKSHTVHYLLGEEEIPVPLSRRRWNNYIEIKNANENNLKGISVKFPLNVMTVVTGVSGSGKSTLVHKVLYQALKRELEEEYTDPSDTYVFVEGNISSLRSIEFVDQGSIGQSTRSNPAIYTKAFEEIRRLWAEQPLARKRGYSAGHFSFNTEGGGRCTECKGEGRIMVDMQFMADVEIECESCRGKRYKDETLQVLFHKKSICDVLEMTVDKAVAFFSTYDQLRIVRKLKPLQDVGLGYIQLGQSTSMLSGGESQRVKLAYYLGLEETNPTLFIFDEPTMGLHFHDIRKLLDAFDALICRGHSVLIIEHNMEVIKCADYVIDLGPEGGEEGGNIVVTGTPEEVAACTAGYTGRYLKEKLR